VLLGVPLQQRIQVAFLRVQARVNLRGGDRDRRLLQQTLGHRIAPPSAGALTFQLLTSSVARVLGLTQFKPGSLQLTADLAQPGRRVLPVACLKIEVPQPKVFQPRLCLLKLAFVGLDLLVEKNFR